MQKNRTLQLKNKEVIKIPQRDKTGPRGKGPRTGRGLGNCKEDEFLGKPIEFFRRRGIGRFRNKK